MDDQWIFVCYSCEVRRYFAQQRDCEAQRDTHEWCNVFTGRVADW